ncbi:MAG: FtsH protease activity modulator HflK [Candidatus Omnitrophica bacterium]|jgi:membrane protease subunit HflK|nr:FtsH protease activity modulator HflK [Candidatus Omnitrophota bacterium]
MADFKTPEDFLNLGRQIPRNPSFWTTLVLGALLVMAALTMFFSVGPDEKGVVQMFGKYIRTVDPGLHMKLPLGIETVTPVRVERIFKEEFGFRTSEAGVRTQYAAKNYLEESLMLTGDLNALEVTWIVQFKVADARKALFSLRDAVRTLRDISEAVMRRLVGDYSVDEVLTSRRAEIGVAAEQEIQQILNSYDSGIHIVTVKLQDVTPPQPVKAAFNDVNEAKQEQERTINQALQAYNEVIPRAKGEAEQMVLEAEAYSVTRVNEAKGDASRFDALLTEYSKFPQVTRARLYLETMEKVLTQTKEKFIMDGEGTNPLPFFDLRQKGNS